MPELAVDAAALLDLAGALGSIGDRLDALLAGLPVPEAAVGSDELVRALENSAHAWQHTLRGAAVAVDVLRDETVSAATVYEDVEALVSSWSTR